MPVDVDKPFTLILEPVKHCNLHCAYCYSDTGAAGVMSSQTLRTILEKAVRYAERQGFQEIHLLWHGGEPLLAGLEFFKDAMAILGEFPAGPRFTQYLQTNGLLLDPDYARFFREHEFKIGISLDGPRDINDALRLYPDGQGSQAAVLEKFQLLQELGVPVGVNAVVTQWSLGRERDIYRFFQSLGTGFRINPVIPGCQAQVSAYLLQPGEYGGFLCRLFDEWSRAESLRVRVSPLDLYLEALVGGKPYECRQRETCAGSHLGIKPAGEAVVCSLFETPVLGNIYELEIEALLAHPFCEALRRRSEALEPCQACRHWAICHGGCPHHALVLGEGALARDPFCPDYQLIFAKIQQALENLQGSGTYLEP